MKRPIMLGLAIATAMLALAGVVGTAGASPRLDGHVAEFECGSCSGGGGS